ncbi:uncharacterized protein LOC119094836 [Pollicipes pollicipes]|uniref:uncharacterized protein LOC119094836 n=1 Tax=Pollicipes pollicipes TaxID=41117 RepID=UPI0018857A77|nr:uncharacterized protein LOC119094836 [Pollicipes pollicipes]
MVEEAAPPRRRQAFADENLYLEPVLAPFLRRTEVPLANRLPDNVVVTLEKAALWKAFCARTNEMIVTRKGRKMFPTIRLKIEGLEKTCLYAMVLEFTQLYDICEGCAYCGPSQLKIIMSASPMARQSLSQNIPTRNVQLGHVSELPHDYSSTPGGTIFSTTPGGTRIVYTGQFLKALRDSPLARTPPAAMAHVPGVTKLPGDPPLKSAAGSGSPPPDGAAAAGDKAHHDGDDPQFEMDM